MDRGCSLGTTGTTVSRRPSGGGSHAVCARGEGAPVVFSPEIVLPMLRVSCECGGFRTSWFGVRKRNFRPPQGPGFVGCDERCDHDAVSIRVSCEGVPRDCVLPLHLSAGKRIMFEVKRLLHGERSKCVLCEERSATQNCVWAT